MSLEIFFCKVVCTYKAVPIFITIFYLLVQKLDFKPEGRPRKDSHWWCDSQSSKKHTCHKKGPWRFRLFSAFPWPDRGDEFMWHNRGVEKCREDKILYIHFNFCISSKVTFCPLSYKVLWKWQWVGRSAWLKQWWNTEKWWGTSVQNRPCK